MRESNAVEKSAYALAAGIYLMLAAPFWLIILPFLLLGWLWKKCSWTGLVIYLLIIAGIVYGVYVGVPYCKELLSSFTPHEPTINNSTENLNRAGESTPDVTDKGSPLWR